MWKTGSKMSTTKSRLVTVIENCLYILRDLNHISQEDVKAITAKIFEATNKERQTKTLKQDRIDKEYEVDFAGVKNV